jgi:hypothetical protein
MKLFSFLLLSSLTIGIQLENQSKNLEMGSSCLPSPLFNVTDFLLPIYDSIVDNYIETNMTGVFLQGVYVENLMIGTNYDRKNWKYETQAVNKNFTKGQTSSFIVKKINGLVPGKYLMQQWLTNTDSKGNLIHLSCWQLEYSLIA